MSTETPEIPENNVESIAKAAYRKKLAALAAQQSVADLDYADAIYTAVSSFGLSEQAFRDAFGLTAGAVERWTQGRNLPQPIVRPKIMAWILTRI
jgi:hypothetical protein